jgi:ubiquinone/menaquinone biosynthesis C-methylase UbiE
VREQDWDARRIQETARAFQPSRILLSGVELGVFAALRAGPRSSAELAVTLEADPRGTDRLLNALVALGLLTKQAGRFANTPAAARHLDPGSPDYLGGLGHTAHLWHTWSTLTEAVRAGRSVVVRRLEGRAEEWFEAFIAAMHARAVGPAGGVAAAMGLKGVTRVLDVGGGSGAFSIAFARAEPGLRATVFDLPNVVPLTRGYIAEAGLSDRIETIAGDYHEDPFPDGLDLVFLSAIIHSNSLEENRALIAKCAGVLAPGGRVVVMDHIMSEDRTAPPRGALFALNMLVGTAGGDTYTESEIREWLAAAGLERIARRTTPMGDQLEGYRSGAARG